MNGVSINIDLPNYGHFSPEELTRKVRCFAIELISQSETDNVIPPCCYTEDEVERLLEERMQSIEDGSVELVSNDDVKAHIKALLA